MKRRKAMIGQDKKLSVNRQCEILNVPKSSFYYEAKGESQFNLSLLRLLDERHLEHPTHGVLQLTDYLRGGGYVVNEKRVRRLMRVAAIEAHYPQRNLSKLLQKQYVRPYLLRNLEIVRANQVWQIDITYIPMGTGFMYLIGIIDAYSRYVVGWKLSDDLSYRNVAETLEAAIEKNGVPEIVNSDQGCQFTCANWLELLDKNGIKASMDGRGRATDNIYIERFWRTLKRDYVYLQPAENGVELYRGLRRWLEFYNNEKTHQSLGRIAPATIYFGNQLNAPRPSGSDEHGGRPFSPSGLAKSQFAC